MSSRQLRKLQKQRELQRQDDAAAERSGSSEDEIVEEAVTAKPRASLFAALGGEDDAHVAADREESDADGSEPELHRQGGVAAEMLEAVAPPPSASRSRTEAKKKKKKKKTKRPALVAPDNAPNANGQEESEEDEIDKAIKDLRVSTRPQAGAPTRASDHRSPDASALFHINTYNLRAVNEMRNLFGRDVVESANAEEEQEINRRRRRQLPREVDLETFLREPPGAKKLPEVSLRRNPFVQGREHWPRQTAAGLTMEEVRKAPDGSWTEYAYCHGKTYDEVQVVFFAYVQMGEPMRMVHLLKQYPYHVSTLLQVSSVAKQDQNMSLAAELCERALFTFGRVTTASFRQDFENGRARLDDRRPENRQFWLAGYHYLKSLIRKGTYRTALEWAKLLYALNPADPYAMRHYVQFLAIRAYEASWLIDFIDCLDKAGENRDVVYLRQTAVLARLQMGEEEAAAEELARGMRRVPWLYCALFQELGLDAPPSIWGLNAESNTRLFWVRLYIHQTKELWNTPERTGLLQTVAKTLDRVDVSSLPADDPPVDLGSTRLAYLEGQTFLLAVAPRHLLDSQPNYEFDPLPPPEQDNIFSGEGTRLPWKDGQTQGRPGEFELLQRMQALMPGRVRGLVPLNHDEDPEDEELRRDLEAHADQSAHRGMLDVMLDMLGLRLGATAGEEEEEADGDEDEDRYEDEVEEEMVPGAWPDGAARDGGRSHGGT